MCHVQCDGGGIKKYPADATFRRVFIYENMSSKYHDDPAEIYHIES